MRKSQLKFLLIPIVLLILYILIKIYNRSPIIENYYTYFKPFYNKDINKKVSFYQKKEYSLNHFQKFFNYKPLVLGYTDKNMYIQNKDEKIDYNEFISFITKLLVANSHFMVLNTKLHHSESELCKNINNRIVDIGHVAAPIVSNAIIGKHSDLFDNSLSNLRFIMKTNKETLLVISKNIDNIKDINSSTRIGLDYKGSTDWLITNDMLNEISNKDANNFNIRYFGNNMNLLKALKNNKIDIIFITIIFPSKGLQFL